VLTDAGPPDNIMPLGFNFLIASSAFEKGKISE